MENDPRVQDAYSLRCMPQVHGAVSRCARARRDIIETETGSATDNPLVFTIRVKFFPGDFHGAPVAMALDYRP